MKNDECGRENVYLRVAVSALGIGVPAWHGAPAAAHVRGGGRSAAANSRKKDKLVAGLNVMKIRFFVGVVCIIATWLGTTAARATDPARSSSCAFAGSNFACTADLDGNGKQQIVIGNVQWFNPTTCTGAACVGYSYMFIINNTGSVRKELCWSESPGQGGVVCPKHN